MLAPPGTLPRPPKVADRPIQITEPPPISEPRDTAVMTAEPEPAEVEDIEVDATDDPAGDPATVDPLAPTQVAAPATPDLDGDWTMTPDDNGPKPLASVPPPVAPVLAAPPAPSVDDGDWTIAPMAGSRERAGPT